MKTNAKKWVVDYSIKYKDGTITEKVTKLRAENINEALKQANLRIIIPTNRSLYVADCVIWSISIFNEDVF